MANTGQVGGNRAYGGQYIWADVNAPQVRALRWVPRGARVLEIGCGYAGVTALLTRWLDCEVVAVDTNEGYARAVESAGGQFVMGDISEEHTLEKIKGRYDAVLLFDVLEHLPDPWSILRRLQAAVVAPLWLVTLPNLLVWHVRKNLLCGRFEYTNSGTLDRTHLRFFTPRTARRLLEESGFSILDQGGTWHVPLLGRAWGMACLAEVADRAQKVSRRFPRTAWIIEAILRAQHVLNQAGLLWMLNSAGQTLRSIFPVLFTNHAVLLARPADAKNTASTTFESAISSLDPRE